MSFHLTNELLLKIQKLPRKDRAAALAYVGQKEFDKISEDPIYWLDAKQHLVSPEWPNGVPYVFTKDPHTLYKCKQCYIELWGDKRADHLRMIHGQEGVISFKSLLDKFEELPPFRPFTLHEYMPPIIEAWQHNSFIAIEKSRDMMATWLIIALYTWDVLFHKGRQNIFQSQDAAKTLELVARAKIIYDHQPPFLKKAIGPVVFSKGTGRSGEMFIVKQEGEILGFPQGPEQIRQYHPSGIFLDEAAYQIEAGAAFAAIKPAIQAGGRFTAISSAQKSWFESVCRDTSDE